MEYFLYPDRAKQEKDWRKKIEAALKDYGFFHDLIDVQRMYAEYCNHGNYGYAGSVLDQPETYWMDMGTMRLLEIYVKDIAPLGQVQGQLTDGVSIFQKAREGKPIF